MEIEIETAYLTIGYYPFRAKAQVLRLLCQYLHIPYQDRFFTPDQWNKFKEIQGDKWIVKDMPFILHEGFMISGTWAPARYVIELANNTDLLGKTERDRIRLDSFKNRVDLKDAMLSLITSNRSSYSSCQQTKKCINQFYQKRIEPILLQYQQECCQNNFFFGYLTLFDFVIYEIINHFRVIYQDGLAKLPKLIALRNKVADIPEIKAYQESPRAVTELCPIKFFNKFKEERLNACKNLSVSSNKCGSMETQ